MDPPREEQVIIAKRWQTFATMPLAVLAILLGLWALTQPYNYLVVPGWVAIFFGAAAIPVLLVQLMRPQRLRLNPEGLVIDAGGLTTKPKFLHWGDVEGFYVWRIRNAKMPAFRYAEGHEPHSAVAQAMRKRTGVDGALAAPWPLQPEVLVNVLNQYRQFFSH
jgi:hypothetical protein